MVSCNCSFLALSLLPFICWGAVILLAPEAAHRIVHLLLFFAVTSSSPGSSDSPLDLWSFVGSPANDLVIICIGAQTLRELGLRIQTPWARRALGLTLITMEVDLTESRLSHRARLPEKSLILQIHMLMID